MWDQKRTDADDGLTAELIKIKGHNGDDIHAYFTKPNGAGPYPGIVIVPSSWLGRAVPRNRTAVR